MEMVNYFLSFTEKNNLSSSTANLVSNLPMLLVYNYGQTADLVSLHEGVTSYKTYKEVLATMVELGYFKYGPDDNINDFDIPNDLIFDIKVRSKQFIESIGNSSNNE